MVMRCDRVGSGNRTGSDFAVPGFGLHPLIGDGPGALPVRSTGLLAAELPCERSRYVDETPAVLPALLALLNCPVLPAKDLAYL